MLKHFRMTYISRVAIPVEVLHRVRPNTASTRWPRLFDRLVKESLIRLYLAHGRLFGTFLTIESRVGRSIGNLESLLASPMMPCRCYMIATFFAVGSLLGLRIVLYNILIPLQISEAHFILHAPLKLISLLQTIIKLLVVLFKVCVVKSWRLGGLQAPLFLISIGFKLFILFFIFLCGSDPFCSLFTRGVNAYAHVLTNFSCDVCNTLLFADPARF